MADELGKGIAGPDKGTETPPETPTPEEVAAKEQSDKEAAEKKESHDERSKQGRQIKALTESVGELVELNKTLIAEREAARKPEETTRQPGDYLTFESLQEINSQKARDEQNKVIDYGRKYTKAIQSVGVEEGLDEEMLGKVVELTTKKGSPFNTITDETASPSAQAEINFHKALRYIEKGGKKNIPGAHDTLLPPEGDPSKTTLKADPDPEFTPEMLEFMKRKNMSKEKAIEFLKKKTPLYAGATG